MLYNFHNHLSARCFFLLFSVCLQCREQQKSKCEYYTRRHEFMVGDLSLSHALLQCRWLTAFSAKSPFTVVMCAVEFLAHLHTWVKRVRERTNGYQEFRNSSTTICLAGKLRSISRMSLGADIDTYDVEIWTLWYYFLSYWPSKSFTFSFSLLCECRAYR